MKRDEDELPKEKDRISFLKALMIPRVVLYSLTFFCTKLATYSVLSWLPTFLKEVFDYNPH
jgi:predicted MFS family arabinose efflux permease